MRQREDLVVDRMTQLRTLIDTLEHEPFPRPVGYRSLGERRLAALELRSRRFSVARVAEALRSLLRRGEAARRRVPVGHHPLDRAAPEIRARQWLTKLVPDQAERYAAQGFIEVQSGLVPRRRYRIHRYRQTDIFDGKRKVARSCLQLVDPSLPDTDRVLTEYFLIRGDEKRYLATANIMRM
jgi:hypothetical protein